MLITLCRFNQLYVTKIIIKKKVNKKKTLLYEASIFEKNFRYYNEIMNNYIYSTLIKLCIIIRQYVHRNYITMGRKTL